MHLFEKEYRDSYLKHHTKPIPVNSLDPGVFYFGPEGGDPILQPEIKQQIIHDIVTINSAENEFNSTRVSDYIITGSILAQNSSERCPINVIVKINKANLTDVLKERILQTIKNINDRLATGTTHPIVYQPTIRDFDLKALTAAYHPFTEKWLKKPEFLEESTDLNVLTKDPAKTKRKHKLLRSTCRKKLSQTKN